VEAPKGKAAGRGKSAAAKRNVSTAKRAADIERVFVHLAHEGDRDGAFGAEIYRTTFGNALNDGITDMVADGLERSTVTSGGVGAFLQRHGF
jgi:hypothetical protein